MWDILLFTGLLFISSFMFGLMPFMFVLWGISRTKEYSFSDPRGDVGELPVFSDEPCKGLHFASTGRQDDRWYNWRVQNWGTKWDCYTLEIDDTDMPHGFEVNFETAWSPPEEVCNAIRDQYDDLSISWFYDEPGCELAGYL